MIARSRLNALSYWPEHADRQRARARNGIRTSGPSGRGLPRASNKLLARIGALPGVYLLPNDPRGWQFGLSSEYAFGSSYAHLTPSTLFRLERDGAVELNVPPDDRRTLLRRGRAVPVPGGLRIAPPTSVSQLEMIWRIILAAYAYAAGPSTRPTTPIGNEPGLTPVRPRRARPESELHTYASESITTGAPQLTA